MMLVLVLVPLTGLIAALLIRWQPAGSDADQIEPVARQANEFKKTTLRGSEP
jgi:hypothetical protein